MVFFILHYLNTRVKIDIYKAGLFVYNTIAKNLSYKEWFEIIMMIEFDDYKSRLNAARPDLDGLGRALKLDDAKAEIASPEAESAKEGFWNDVNNSQKMQKRLKQLQNKVAKYEKLCAQ